jgi:hypothetical protein
VPVIRLYRDTPGGGKGDEPADGLPVACMQQDGHDNSIRNLDDCAAKATYCAWAAENTSSRGGGLSHGASALFPRGRELTDRRAAGQGSTRVDGRGTCPMALSPCPREQGLEHRATVRDS